MYWFSMILAIILEVLGTTAMKLSYGLTKLFPSLMVFIFYVLSLTFLAIAFKKIEVSLAYAVWSGLGTGAIALIGILYFNEQMNVVKFISIILIIIGVIGLNLNEHIIAFFSDLKK